MEKSQFLMGKSTISMAIFNSFLYVYQRVFLELTLWLFNIAMEKWPIYRWFSQHIPNVFPLLSTATSLRRGTSVYLGVGEASYGFVPRGGAGGFEETFVAPRPPGENCRES